MSLHRPHDAAPGAAPVYIASIVWFPIADPFDSRCLPASPIPFLTLVLLFLLLLLVITFLIQIFILLLLPATKQEQDLPSPLFPISNSRLPIADSRFFLAASRIPRPEPRSPLSSFVIFVNFVSVR